MLLGSAWGPTFPEVDKLTLIGVGKFSDEPPLIEKGKQKRINYASPNMAAFLLWLSKDAKGILKALRFGGGSANGAYIAVSPNDAIYTSGRCTEGFKLWLKGSDTPHTIISPPDGEGKVQWAMVFERAEGGVGGAEGNRGQAWAC